MPTVVKLCLKQMAQCRKTLEIEEVDRTTLYCQMSDPKLPIFGTYVRKFYPRVNKIRPFWTTSRVGPIKKYCRSLFHVWLILSVSRRFWRPIDCRKILNRETCWAYANLQTISNTHGKSFRSASKGPSCELAWPSPRLLAPYAPYMAQLAS